MLFDSPRRQTVRGFVYRIDEERRPCVLQEVGNGLLNDGTEGLHLQGHLHDPLRSSDDTFVTLILDVAGQDRSDPGHLVKNEGVVVGVRIGELPLGHELFEVLLERVVGTRLGGAIASLGVYGQLRQEPRHGVGDALLGASGSRLEDFHHRVGGQALTGVEHEASSLAEITAHVDEPLEGRVIQTLDEVRDVLANLSSLASALELFRQLEQVSHDHLIVRLLRAVSLDGCGNGLGRGRLVCVVCVVAGHGRASEAEPKLRGPVHRDALHSLAGVFDLKPVVPEGIEMDVVPIGNLVPGQ